jgi:hypothetical protein
MWYVSLIFVINFLVLRTVRKWVIQQFHQLNSIFIKEHTKIENILLEIKDILLQVLCLMFLLFGPEYFILRPHEIQA